MIWKVPQAREAMRHYEREERRVRVLQILVYFVLGPVLLSSVIAYTIVDTQPLAIYFIGLAFALTGPMVIIYGIALEMANKAEWSSVAKRIFLWTIFCLAVGVTGWLVYPDIFDVPLALQKRYSVIEGIPSVRIHQSQPRNPEGLTLTLSGVSFYIESNYFPEVRDPLLMMFASGLEPKLKDQVKQQTVRITYLPHSRWVLDIRMLDH